MAFSIPEFPEEHRSRLVFAMDRMAYWQTSTDLESSPALSRYLQGPELSHKPLRFEIDRAKHRALAAEKWHDGHRTYPMDRKRSVSSDHLYESYLRMTFDSSCEALSKNSNSGSRESILEENHSDESVLEAEQSECGQQDEVITEPKDRLCNRCCMINIDNLTEGVGYKHSTLDILESSAKSCKLCHNIWNGLQGFFTSQERLDRYEMILLLDLHKRGGNGRQDRSHNDELPWKCIYFRVIDMWRGQYPEERESRMMQDDELKQEPVVRLNEDQVGIHEIQMMCYTEEGDPATSLGVPWLRKKIEPTDSSSSLIIANGWLNQCLTVEGSGMGTCHDIASQDAQCPNDNHETGSESLAVFPAERPTRLLEIIPCSVPDDLYGHTVKLIETEGRSYTYLALSYCWGKVPDTIWMTTTDTIRGNMQGIDLKSLPATIRDCLQVAPALGVRYVWVDSLCIIQDDISDWEVESAKMGGIYRGAVLTIAASKGSSSSEGLFNRNKTPYHFNPFAFFNYICVESRLRNNHTSRLYFDTVGSPSSEEDLFAWEVYSSPLSRRAWALQEQVLSRRILYFGESQLYWECKHCRLSQNNAPHDYPITGEYRLSTFSEPLSTRDVMGRWYRNAVENYTRRGLTNPDDKLVAISAIARATYLNRGVKYAAGLWQDCILPGLCWYRQGIGRKHKAARCPSWSWASQLSLVRYKEAIHKHEETRENYPNVPKVLDIQVIPSEKNPFGHVNSGRITLYTRVTQGTVMRYRLGYYGTHSLSNILDRQILVISQKSGSRVWHGDAMMDDEGRKHQKVTVALLNYWNTDWSAEKSRWLLLLLEDTGEKDQSYKRVGLGVVESEWDPMTDEFEKMDFDPGWTEQTITIV